MPREGLFRATIRIVQLRNHPARLFLFVEDPAVEVVAAKFFRSRAFSQVRRAD